MNLALLAAAATGVQVGATIVASRYVVAEVPPVTAVVIGDIVNPTVGVLIKLGGRAFLFPPSAFSRARQTAICDIVFTLSLSENLHTRIALGTVDLGHRSRCATVCAMRLSARPPTIPDMLTMTFCQSESRICGQGTSN